jgi:hypothetical protein
MVEIYENGQISQEGRNQGVISKYKWDDIAQFQGYKEMLQSITKI